MVANRAGGTSQRCGNPPAVSFSPDFKPNKPEPEILDWDGIVARAGSRGFVDAATVQARSMFERIGYAHASTYFPPAGACDGTTLRDVHQSILFDRAMQSILLEYIGYFELQFRAQYSYHMAIESGAFAHRYKENFKREDHFLSFLNTYEGEFARQMRIRNGKISSLYAEYGDVPIWHAVEIMTFGTLSKMYRNTRSKSVRMAVADSFGVDYATLSSWMRTISFVRNRCAHFGSLMNSALVSQPKRIEGLLLETSHPFYSVLILEKMLSAPEMYTGDMSMNYSIELLTRIVTTIGEFSCAVTGRYLPSDWKDLLLDKRVTRISVEFINGIEQKPLHPTADQDSQGGGDKPHHERW